MRSNLDISSMHINNYEQAISLYDRMRPWRGETDHGDERPLLKRVRNRGVRLNAAKDVLFRYHCTDVVEYQANGTIVIRGYASKTTSQFADAVLPDGVYASMTSEVVLDHNISKAYRLTDGGVLAIHPDGSITPDEPWVKFEVDRKKSSALRKEYRIPQIQQWLKAATALDPNRNPAEYDTDNPFRRWTSISEQLEALKDQRSWVWLTRGTLDTLYIEALRYTNALYKTEPRDAILPTAVSSYRAAWKKWGNPQP